jgi:hypothetical protein
MADSPAFERAAEELEKASGLARLEARGTLRLVLKNIGLDPKTATKLQVKTIAEKLLPQELAARGVAEPTSISAKVSAALASLQDGGPGASALEVFERIARVGSRSRS